MLRTIRGRDVLLFPPRNMSTAAFLAAALTLGSASIDEAIAGDTRSTEDAPPPAVGERVAVEIVIVRPGPADADALQQALAARTPGIELYTFGAPGTPSPTGDVPGRRVFVDIVAHTLGYSMTFILSDGRAYQRNVRGGEGDVRELASAIANTLAAIEDAAILPEPEPAIIPVDPETTVSKPPETNVVPPSEQPEQPKPASESDPKSQPPLPKPVENFMSVRAPPEFGFALAPTAALLLAPGQLQGASGFGGSLHGSLRFPRGLGLDLGVRTLALERDDLWLVRTRVGIATGYIHRDGHLELAGLAGISVEPWSLRELGKRVPLGAGPLLGGFASLALGYRVQVRERLALRVGGRLELAGSVLPSGRVPEVRRASESTEALALGGFELALALDLKLWISLKKN